MKIENKVIAITGAAQGLGAKMALRLGKAGAKLALLDINLEKLNAIKSQLNELAIEAEVFVTDVSNENSVNQSFENIQQAFSNLDVLVNNAGIIRDQFLNKTNKLGDIESLPLSTWQSVIDVNLTGVFLCGREASKLMIQNKTAGVIVNISSISRSGNIGQSNYSAAKAGVVALTTTWAKELSRAKVRVGAVAPGFIKTEMIENIKPALKQMIESSIPCGRMGEPDEIAHAVQFIVENDYFNGRVLELDGGMRI